ncbi:hypothetical protein NL676_025031 [Syzygium grande]|nr:hypothetical protein NL676_025031 [Syzygium grande]
MQPDQPNVTRIAITASRRKGPDEDLERTSLVDQTEEVQGETLETTAGTAAAAAVAKGGVLAANPVMGDDGSGRRRIDGGGGSAFSQETERESREEGDRRL